MIAFTQVVPPPLSLSPVRYWVVLHRTLRRVDVFLTASTTINVNLQSASPDHQRRHVQRCNEWNAVWIEWRYRRLLSMYFLDAAVWDSTWVQWIIFRQKHMYVSLDTASHKSNQFPIGRCFRWQQELSYRKQIAHQLRIQYVEGIHKPKYYTVTLKSRLRVTQGHWKRNHWIDHTRLTISQVIWRSILSWPWNVG